MSREEILRERLDRLARGWRGPVLAAAVAFLAALPGLLGVPVIDRDEARFAQASAQMLESGDFVTIRFQQTPRFKKPVGIYWLQAGAVRLASEVEARRIWAWRLPSLLGVMAAAAACAWGAAAFLSPGSALLAGALLGSGLLLSIEGGIAATDAVLAGSVTAAMAALGRLYLAGRGGPPAGRRVKALFWAAMAMGILVKGPVAPLIAALALLTLALWDRKAAWIARLEWGWGLIFVAAVVGPWAMAITVATDGAFWRAAVGGDLAPKLAGVAEGHGAVPGFYLGLAPLTLFPATLLLAVGAVTAWRRRSEPAVRFALAWLVPAWLLFEAVPTKLVHYPLPLYGALAWLMALAVGEPQAPWTRRAGAALSLLAGLGLAAVCLVAAARLGGGLAWVWAAIAAALFGAAGAAGAGLLLRGETWAATLAALALGLVAHGVAAGGLAPSLSPMWLSQRASAALAASGADPRQGLLPSPVSVAGYEEPSLIFLLGTDTRLGGPGEAAAAIAEGRPAIVEARVDPAFRAALGVLGARAGRSSQVAGLDYSNGRRDTLILYRPEPGAVRPR